MKKIKKFLTIPILLLVVFLVGCAPPLHGFVMSIGEPHTFYKKDQSVTISTVRFRNGGYVYLLWEDAKGLQEGRYYELEVEEAKTIAPCVVHRIISIVE